MWDWVRLAGWSVASALRSRRDLALENVALRHQLMVLRRRLKRRYEKGNRRGVSPKMVAKLRAILADLDAAEQARDLVERKGYDTHP